MANQDWKTALVVLIAVAVGALLAGGGLFRGAYAQGDGRAGGVSFAVGDERSGDIPIFLVDEPDQALVVYRYDYSAEELELTAVRSFRYDKRLVDYSTSGPSVDSVREQVAKMEAGRR